MTSILKTDEIQSQNGGAVVKMQTLKHPSASGNNITLDGSNNVSLGGTLSAGTIGGDVAMASSGVTVRNITQVALANDQGLSGNSDLTTYFSPTYTNLFSGSKVQGALTFIGNSISTSGYDSRSMFVIAYSGSNITPINFQRNSSSTPQINFGGYDYGDSGIQFHYTFTVFGPLLTTNAVSTITANCKLQNNTSSSSQQWNVYGDGTVGETHFTWIEYK